MKEILQKLYDYFTLTKQEAKTILEEISKGTYNENEVAAFISIFLMRNLTLAELEGFREALQELSTKVNLGTDDLVDIVGTGGDGKNTFNITTLSYFIVAGTGQKVAKHGNYGVSSISGSSTVLEGIGYVFKTKEDDLKRDLDKANLCFLHAPIFHPALKNVAPVRRNLGLRTFFNILGPLINPAKPKFSTIGVYNLEIARLYQYLLQKDNQPFTLVHGLDGYDEISLTQDSKIITQKGEKIYTPEELGFCTVSPESIGGGYPPDEPRIARAHDPGYICLKI